MLGAAPRRGDRGPRATSPRCERAADAAARLLLDACYGALSPHEVVDATARKVVGLAQVRRRHAALFQVGILLRDQSPLADLLAFPTKRAREALRGRAARAARPASRPRLDQPEQLLQRPRQPGCHAIRAVRRSTASGAPISSGRPQCRNAGWPLAALGRRGLEALERLPLAVLPGQDLATRFAHDQRARRHVPDARLDEHARPQRAAGDRAPARPCTSPWSAHRAALAPGAARLGRSLESGTRAGSRRAAP